MLLDERLYKGAHREAFSQRSDLYFLRTMQALELGAAQWQT